MIDLLKSWGRKFWLTVFSTICIMAVPFICKLTSMDSSVAVAMVTALGAITGVHHMANTFSSKYSYQSSQANVALTDIPAKDFSSGPS